MVPESKAVAGKTEIIHKAFPLIRGAFDFLLSKTEEDHDKQTKIYA